MTDVRLLQGACSCASKGFSIRCPACAEAVTPEQVLDGKDSSRRYLGPGLAIISGYCWCVQLSSISVGAKRTVCVLLRLTVMQLLIFFEFLSPPPFPKKVEVLGLQALSL